MMKTAALGLALCASVLAIPVDARAQSLPELKCEELKEEAIAPIAALCKAHIGCGYVLNSHRRCADAKGYLERLQNAIGEGTKTLFGSRKQITPDAIFKAELGGEDRANARSLDTLPFSQRWTQGMDAAVREAGPGDILSGTSADGRSWVYYGQVKEGQPDGWGTRIYSNGEIVRGQTAPSKNVAGLDILYPGGDRFVGSFKEGVRSGQGVRASADGARFEGAYIGGRRYDGKQFGSDGKLAEEGRYDKDVLSVGTRYDAAGSRTEVNLPAAREAAAQEAADKARLAAQAEQQRKRDDEQRKQEAAAQAEQQFRTSLQTMNPGQLFAKADELNAQGDSGRAREAQRALIERFPNHPMAATVARQIAGPSPSSAPQGNRGNIGTLQTPASIPIATPGQSTRQQIDGGSGLVVRASQGALTPPRSGGRAIEPATLYAHRDLNFTSGDVGWIIATSAQEAAKAGEEEYGYSNLSRAIRYGKTEDYLALDFGWFAFIDSYAESGQYPGHLSDNAKRVWAYAARSREEAIATAIREYENVRGSTVAQFVYSGLIAKIDRRDRGQVNCTVCKPDMLYRSFCSVGGKQGQFVRFLNRNPRLVPSQFEGMLCETNASIPFMRAQENSPPPVLR
ncbi:hypothetical protein [Variovorax boronicumulans]|uniref:hypothetical protein n=1 Tax=Variovorax boronicumulans TaxID=436515 RepID=UPI0012FD2811|nr:hypothetical protein [Variovorax boronicumulans]